MVPEPQVVAVEQRGGFPYVDIDYVVHDADSSNVFVSALAFVDGGNTLGHVLKLNTLIEGTATNLGANIPANQQHRLTWNAAADWNTNFGNVQIEVLANDGRGLMDFHLLKIPSNGPNPELVIDRYPVTQTNLLSCWYWLVATNDPQVALNNGVVCKTGEPDSGAVLYTSAAWPMPTQTEVEPNNTNSTATALSPGSVGALGEVTLNDNDWFSFTCPAPGSTVEAKFAAVASPARTMGYIRDGGTNVYASQTSSSASYLLKTTLPDAGTYYVHLRNNSSSYTGAYQVVVAVDNSITVGTTAKGRKFLFDRMGVREATPAEIVRASVAETPGVTNRWATRIFGDPRISVNEYGFSTATSWGTTAWYVVKP